MSGWATSHLGRFRVHVGHPSDARSPQVLDRPISKGFIFFSIILDLAVPRGYSTSDASSITLSNHCLP